MLKLFILMLSRRIYHANVRQRTYIKMTINIMSFDNDAWNYTMSTVYWNSLENKQRLTSFAECGVSFSHVRLENFSSHTITIGVVPFVQFNLGYMVFCLQIHCPPWVFFVLCVCTGSSIVILCSITVHGQFGWTVVGRGTLEGWFV